MESLEVDAAAKGHRTPAQVAASIGNALLCTVTCWAARVREER